MCTSHIVRKYGGTTTKPLNRWRAGRKDQAKPAMPAGTTAETVTLPISTFTAWDGYQYGSSTIRAAIDAIARHAGKLKGTHIITGGTGRKIGDANLNRILQTAPNPYMGSYDAVYKLVTHMETRGNAFAYLEKDARGNLVHVWPVDCSSCEFCIDGAGTLFVRFHMPNGETYTFAYSDLVHLRKHFNANPLMGEGNDALGPVMEAAHAQDEGIVAGIEAGASIRGVLQFTQILSPEKREEEREKFVTNYLAMSNNSGVVVIDQKMTYTPIDSKPVTVNAEQMAQVEKRVYNYFGLSEAVINSTCDEAQFQAFYEGVIEPIAVQLSQEFTNKVFTARERAFGNEIVFEGNRLQFGTLEHKAAAIEKLVPYGLISINQALDMLNLPPIEGGDKRLQSLNYIDAAIAQTYQLADKSTGTQTDTNEEAADDERQA